MPSELPQMDFNFLWKLSSAYHAVASSACDPVVVPSGLGLAGDRRNRFHDIYYDDADDEEGALKVMQRRLEIAPVDIREHLQIHDSLRYFFYSVQEGWDAGSRDRAVSNAGKLYAALRGYGDLVERHREQTRDDAFLRYPVCVEGHYFFIPNSQTREIPMNEFNNAGTKRGFLNELGIAQTLIEQFSQGNLPLFQVKLAHLVGPGEGVRDGSISGGLERTRELLRRAGFEG